MSKLDQLQKGFLKWIYSPSSGEPAPGLEQIPVDRLNLYRRMTQARLREALDSVYSMTQKAWPLAAVEQAWENLAVFFFSEFPPRDRRLNESVRDFPIFLRTRFPGASWLAELAEFEWARFFARSSEDAEPLELIAPSASFLCLENEIPQWFLDLEESLETLHLPEKCSSSRPGTFVVFRESDPHRPDPVQVLRLDPPAWWLLSRLAQNQPLGDCIREIAEQSGAADSEVQVQVSRILSSLRETGLVLVEPIFD